MSLDIEVTVHLPLAIFFYIFKILLIYKTPFDLQGVERKETFVACSM